MINKKSEIFEHFQLLNNRKSQLNMKGMVIKYLLAFFFVAITVVALSQMGMIGKITPGGGVRDLGITGPGQITAAAIVDVNNTKVNDTTEIEINNTE